MFSETKRIKKDTFENCVDDDKHNTCALDTLFDFCGVSTTTRTSNQEVTIEYRIATIAPLTIFSLVSTMLIVLCVSVQDDGSLLNNLLSNLGLKCLLFLIFPLFQISTAAFFADTDTSIINKKAVSLRSLGMIAWLFPCFYLMLKDEI